MPKRKTRSENRSQKQRRDEQHQNPKTSVAVRRNEEKICNDLVYPQISSNGMDVSTTKSTEDWPHRILMIRGRQKTESRHQTWQERETKLTSLNQETNRYLHNATDRKISRLDRIDKRRTDDNREGRRRRRRDTRRRKTSQGPGVNKNGENTSRWLHFFFFSSCFLFFIYVCVCVCRFQCFLFLSPEHTGTIRTSTLFSVRYMITGIKDRNTNDRDGSDWKGWKILRER